jgi:hypothetical protein
MRTKLNQRLTYVIQKLIHFTVINYSQNVLKPNPMKYFHFTVTSRPVFRVTRNGLAVCVCQKLIYCYKPTGPNCQAVSMK